MFCSSGTKTMRKQENKRPSKEAQISKRKNNNNNKKNTRKLQDHENYSFIVYFSIYSVFCLWF